MIIENKNYVDLAKKFINEHNNNNNWSPFDRIEIIAIMMYAEWLESDQFSLEKKGKGLLAYYNKNTYQK